MRLVSFGDPGRERPGVVVEVDGVESVVAVAALVPSWPPAWRSILDELEPTDVVRTLDEALSKSAQGLHTAVALGSVRLGPPIPEPSKVLALGLNFRTHAAEQKREPPRAPLLFAKAPSCLVGPRDPIRLPDPAVEDRVDAEAELCVVIGRRAKDLAPERALESVLGWTVMNDVSGRACQFADRQWFRGKSFDTFGPCGPWIVTRDALPDPGGLTIEANWNGRVMQSGNTRDLIFSVPVVVAYASRAMTLRPGDLIAMGTPDGVGVFRDPPEFLRAGDVVHVRLEGVGDLVNPVVAFGRGERALGR